MQSCRSHFFFSSRRPHTRFSGDWSSDVCSSDLNNRDGQGSRFVIRLPLGNGHLSKEAIVHVPLDLPKVEKVVTSRESDISVTERSEERRVGKECRSRMSNYY